MRWVEVAAVRPHHCAHIPFLGTNHPKGYFDWGTELWGGDHAYCSVVAAEEMARFLGWVPPDVVRHHEQTVIGLQERIGELEACLAEAERFREAAEYTLNQFGATVKKKPGRKPKEAVA